MPKLTQRTVDTRKASSTRLVFLRDDELQGFGLRVTQGCKSYFVECRVNGKPKRITIGKHPLLRLEEARKRAKDMLRQMYSGFDPLAERRRKEVSGITLAKYWTFIWRPRNSDPGQRYPRIFRIFATLLSHPIMCTTCLRADDRPIS